MIFLNRINLPGSIVVKIHNVFTNTKPDIRTHKKARLSARKPAVQKILSIKAYFKTSRGDSFVVIIERRTVTIKHFIDPKAKMLILLYWNFNA